jgi:hypothetical protein
MKLIFILLFSLTLSLIAGLYNNGTQSAQRVPTNVAPDSGYIAIVTILVATLLVLVLTVVSPTLPRVRAHFFPFF